MGIIDSQDHVAAFTEELLRTGLMLSDLGADLVEALPTDAYPGEEPGAVIIEMITGTIRTALGDADESDVRRAVELMVEAKERVLEHLQLALELSRRMNGDDAQPPRRTQG
jgi:hypothetical protein